jgi:hypothetical protein
MWVNWSKVYKEIMKVSQDSSRFQRKIKSLEAVWMGLDRLTLNVGKEKVREKG